MRTFRCAGLAGLKTRTTKAMQKIDCHGSQGSPRNDSFAFVCPPQAEVARTRRRWKHFQTAFHVRIINPDFSDLCRWLWVGLDGSQMAVEGLDKVFQDKH